MLICSLTVCVYLQVCIHDNMIFAHENKKKWEDKVNCSSPSNNWIWSRNATHNKAHTLFTMNKKKRTHESAQWKCKVNCYCCVLLRLCSLSDSLENCRFFLSSSNRIFDHHLSSNEMTQIELDCLNIDWLFLINSIAIYVFLICPSVINAYTPLYSDYKMRIQLYLISNSNDESKL
jgi:hypothetical protein